MQFQAFAGRVTVMDMLDSDRQDDVISFRSMRNKTYLIVSTEGLVIECDRCPVGIL